MKGVDMSRNGLLIDYEYCTGCQSCAVACKQERNYPAGKWGIKVDEKVFVDPDKPDKIRIDYIPFPTEFCDLCAARTRKGEQPTCVKHCQAACIYFGPVSQLAQEMEKRPKTVLYSPD